MDGREFMKDASERRKLGKPRLHCIDGVNW